MLSRQSGLTLTELMVGLALSLFLMAGVVALFVSQKESYSTTMAVSRVLESGKVAVDILSHDIRMTGYQGCPDPVRSPAKVLAVGAFTDDFQETSLRGFETDESGWTSGEEDTIAKLADGINDPANVDNPKYEVVPGTDVIAVQYASIVGTPLIQHDVANQQLVIDDDYSKTVAQGALLLVADCDEADIIYRTNEPGEETGGPLKYETADGFVNRRYDDVEGQLSKNPYDPDNTVVYRFTSKIFFVGQTGRTTADGQPINALYVQPSGSSKASELISGVENMQVVYGQSDGAGNIRYVDADDGAVDMELVVSVKIGLMTASKSEVLTEDDSLTYVLAGTSASPSGGGGTLSHAGDKQLRRVFNTVISLRNRRSAL